MESYRTEEEQVEALRKWWDENGRSTVIAVVIALAAGFGWQGWQGHQKSQREQASDTYQAMMRAVSAQTGAPSSQATELAEQLKADFPASTYAQFAALHLAAFAVQGGDLAVAEAELRWVLGRADKGSDTAEVAQLRLARVMAAKGEAEQALAILDQGAGTYRASYALARGDILMGLGRDEAARMAYAQALAEAGGVGANLGSVRQKLQSLAAAEVSGEQTTEITAAPLSEPAPLEEPVPAQDSADSATVESVDVLEE